MNQNEMTEFFRNTEATLHLDGRNELSMTVEYDSNENSVFYALSAKLPGGRGRAKFTQVRGYGITPEGARQTLGFVLTRDHNWAGNPEETNTNESE